MLAVESDRVPGKGGRGRRRESSDTVPQFPLPPSCLGAPFPSSCLSFPFCISDAGLACLLGLWLKNELVRVGLHPTPDAGTRAKQGGRGG